MADPRKPRILILGGGINGAAIARALTACSFPVCLVDRGDIAGGTTSASSRLIHGGLRYLEYGELSLVRESLGERAKLLRSAPHLVKPLKLYIPVGRRWGGIRQALVRFFRHRDRRRHVPRGLYLVEAGLWLYDLFSRSGKLPKRKGPARVGLDSTPAVNPRLYRWICEYYDAQVLYPERLVVEMLEDARSLAGEWNVDFHVLTHSEAVPGENHVVVRRLPGPVRDRDAPDEFRYEPALIINATGAWVDDSLRRLGVTSDRLMGGTKGSHIVSYHAILRERLDRGGIYAEAEDGRPVFILPLGEAALVGTTDIRFEGPAGEAVADRQELAYLTETVRRVFPDLDFTEQDVALHYCGVRPLPYVDASSPAGITRRHSLKLHSADGTPVLSVVGGKLTTCGSLAEEAVRAVCERLGIDECPPRIDRPLPGAVDYPMGDEATESAIERIAERTGFDRDQVAASWRLYGTRTEEVLRQENSGFPAAEAAQSVLAGTALPVPVVRHAIRREWVVNLEDLVERRLMLLYDRRIRGDTLKHLAQILVEEGRLTEREVGEEVERCRRRLSQRFGRRVSDAD